MLNDSDDQKRFSSSDLSHFINNAFDVSGEFPKRLLQLLLLKLFRDVAVKNLSIGIFTVLSIGNTHRYIFDEFRIEVRKCTLFELVHELSCLFLGLWGTWICFRACKWRWFCIYVERSLDVLAYFVKVICKGIRCS